MRPLVLSLLVLTAGCSKLPKLPKSVDGWLPEVAFQTLNVNDVDLQGAKAVFVLDVTNPHPVGLQIPSVNWDLDLAGSDFLEGLKDTPLAVDAQGTTPVRIPVQIAWSDVLAVANGAKGQDAIPFAIAGDLTIDTPLGPVKAPFQHAGELPVLHVPKVKLAGLRVTSLDVLKGQADLAVDLDVEADGAAAIGFDALDYTVALGGKDVASGSTSWTPKAGSSTLTLPIGVKLVSVGEAVVTALTKKTDLKVGLVGDAKLDTPLGVVPMGIDESTMLKVR